MAFEHLSFTNWFSDEFFYAPIKKTINSFKTDETFKCLSPFGPVCNMNCPEENPTCNCPQGVVQLQPVEDEPDFDNLKMFKGFTDECNQIVDQLSSPEWLGIDFSNPHSNYNCDYCVYAAASTIDEPYNDTPDYIDLEPVSKDWSPWFPVIDQGQKKYVFNYDKRKTYNGHEYPQGTTLSNPGENCDQVIGNYFKYYKEYSKTAATFWNTPVETPLYRKAQTALMMAQRIKILVHGDIRAKPGKLIYVDYPNFGGRWMIYKVQRIITPQKHSMYLYLMRDGVA